MNQVLDDGRIIHFGQALSEIEDLFSAKAADVPMPIARPGIDRMLKFEDLSLRFDTGRLMDIEFNYTYGFKYPPSPYSELWKNFAVIGEKRIQKGMNREEFLTYIEAWEARANSLGSEKVDAGDLTPRQYFISKARDDFWDTVHISMGPSRRSGGGGIWCDAWHISFVLARRLVSFGKSQPGTLKSISAFRDAFNTVARRKKTE